MFFNNKFYHLFEFFYIKILNSLYKNIFNNFLIAESCRTRTHLFQKLPSPAPVPAPTPESRNALVLHRWVWLNFSVLSFFVSMAELALERKKKKLRLFSSFSKACIVGWLFWVWVGGGWMRKREKQRDGEQRRREKRDRFFYIILIYCM